MDYIANGQWVEPGREAKREPARIDIGTVETAELVDAPSVQLTITFGEAAHGTARSVEIYLPTDVAEALVDALNGAAIDTRRVPADDTHSDYSG